MSSRRRYTSQSQITITQPPVNLSIVSSSSPIHATATLCYAIAQLLLRPPKNNRELRLRYTHFLFITIVLHTQCNGMTWDSSVKSGAALDYSYCFHFSPLPIPNLRLRALSTDTDPDPDPAET